MGIYGLLFILGVIIWYFFRLQKARQIILEWSLENGIKIKTLSYVWFFPKNMGSLRIGLEMVYHIEAFDGDGVIKNGYIKVGKILTGLSEKTINVNWN